MGINAPLVGTALNTQLLSQYVRAYSRTKDEHVSLKYVHMFKQSYKKTMFSHGLAGIYIFA